MIPQSYNSLTEPSWSTTIQKIRNCHKSQSSDRKLKIEQEEATHTKEHPKGKLNGRMNAVDANDSARQPRFCSWTCSL